MQMAFPEMDDEIDLDDDFYKNCFIFNSTYTIFFLADFGRVGIFFHYSWF